MRYGKICAVNCSSWQVWVLYKVCVFTIIIYTPPCYIPQPLLQVGEWKETTENKGVLLCSPKTKMHATKLWNQKTRAHCSSLTRKQMPFSFIRWCEYRLLIIKYVFAFDEKDKVSMHLHSSYIKG